METAHRALSECGQILRYGMATGRTSRDASIGLSAALKPIKPTHFAAVTDPKEVGPLLRGLHAYHGSFVTRSALRIAPLVFVRPGELRKAEWQQIDLDAAEWRYTSTKTDTPHIVPLADQAVEILRELHAVTGNRQYVFAGPLERQHFIDCYARSWYRAGKDEHTWFSSNGPNDSRRSAWRSPRFYRASIGACGQGSERPGIQSNCLSSGTQKNDATVG